MVWIETWPSRNCICSSSPPDAWHNLAESATVEQLIVEVLAREIRDNLGADALGCGDGEVELPVIRSKQPGTLDLSHFDFDDLLG